MNRPYILAIDPGNKESGFCLIDSETLRPVWHEKMDNSKFKWEVQFNHFLSEYLNCNSFYVVIERVASYGMAVGAEVFETCEWIGRFNEFFLQQYGQKSHFVYRKEEKLHFCYSMKANDSNIRQALVDRFAPGQSNYGKGTKKEPGWFYGFKADEWSAYAVAVLFADTYLRAEEF